MPHPQLHPALAQAFTARGYDELTPVQSAVIAEEALGRDLIVSSRTGSGKTVAFGLAMAPALLEGGSRAEWETNSTHHCTDARARNSGQ